ncbi:MAG: hypothetical protein WAL75_25500, partial [Terracidiphilus sp.]
VWSEAVKFMSDVAPIQMMGAYNATAFKPHTFFRAAVKQVGELRVDRPTVRTVGHLWTHRNRIRFASALKYALAASEGIPPYQLWLRPTIPFWGITKLLNGITEAVSRQFMESNENVTPIHSIIIGDERKNELFKYACDGCVSIPEYELPSGMEAFVVPGHIAYVAVNTPIEEEQGFPIPLGILTFDPIAVAKVQKLLTSLIENRLASESHCSWAPNRLMQELKGWLEKSTSI